MAPERRRPKDEAAVLTQQPQQPRPAVPGELEDRRWSLLQRELKLHWSRLSSDEVLRAATNRDALLSVLYERYGYTASQANSEIDHVLRKYS